MARSAPGVTSPLTGSTDPGAGVQKLGGKVGAVGPDEGVKLGVERENAEESWIPEGQKDRAIIVIHDITPKARFG